MGFCEAWLWLLPVTGSLFLPLPLKMALSSQGFLLEAGLGVGAVLPGPRQHSERGNRVGLSPTHEWGLRWDPHDLLVPTPTSLHTHTSHWACNLPASGPLRPRAGSPSPFRAINGHIKWPRACLLVSGLEGGLRGQAGRGQADSWQPAVTLSRWCPPPPDQDVAFLSH